ncbi:acetyl-CoA carboxylase biotin carboxyl carrier protein subunit [Bradyrhizobium sp. Ec3.3]|uniref:acetyl-CoA carboxylase biotin carboxyl carrier protein subunit n=1 Tax=Bradyrhizobium sp. Ec3.3 TaxID=189753 RepID=UPI00048A1492|nr:acetyl-CoA carboxylase biotin carboxyl carrier protein subunit [Bradyrhizobium sp. Ec3.3]
MKHSFALDVENYELWLSPGQHGYRLHLDDEVFAPVSFSHELDGSGTLVIASDTIPVKFAIDGDRLYLHIRGRTYILRYRDQLRTLACLDDQASHLVARAPMPGVVIATKVSRGDVVSGGATLMLVESMKLEFVVRAPRGGVVERIHFGVGDSFERDSALVTFSEEGR